jgi:hypothetical protein
MERLIWALIIIAAAMVFLIIFLDKKVKNKFLLYIPSIVMFILGIIFFIWGNFYAEPMQDLGMFLLTMICMVIAIITSITALVLRYRNIKSGNLKPQKTKNKKANK